MISFVSRTPLSPFKNSISPPPQSHPPGWPIPAHGFPSPLCSSPRLTRILLSGCDLAFPLVRKRPVKYNFIFWGNDSGLFLFYKIIIFTFSDDEAPAYSQVMNDEKMAAPPMDDHSPDIVEAKKAEANLDDNMDEPPPSYPADE